MSDLGCVECATCKCVRRTVRTAVNGVECKEVAGNGWGEEAAGNE